MIRACVIGDPVTQSLSPVIFRYLAYKQGLSDFDYFAEKVGGENLLGFTLRARKEFRGFNVTLPLKQDILGFIDILAPEAKAVGAVNAVKVENAKLWGFNTDVAGIKGTLAENKIAIVDKKVLILGAGGAARAATYACAELGAETVSILNKTPSKAQEISSGT